MNADKPKVSSWVVATVGLWLLGWAYLVIMRGGWYAAALAAVALVYVVACLVVGVPAGLEAQRVYRQRKAAAAAVAAAGVACVGVQDAIDSPPRDQAQHAGHHTGLTARGTA